jgi:hypothetical protein
MRQSIEFGCQIRQIATTRTSAQRVTTLRHKFIDHPMEHQSVVKTPARQSFDPLNMMRRGIWPKLDDYTSAS